MILEPGFSGSTGSWHSWQMSFSVFMKVGAGAGTNVLITAEPTVFVSVDEPAKDFGGGESGASACRGGGEAAAVGPGEEEALCIVDGLFTGVVAAAPTSLDVTGRIVMAMLSRDMKGCKLSYSS